MTRSFAIHIKNMVPCTGFCGAQIGEPCKTEAGKDKATPHDCRTRKHRRECRPCIYQEVNG